MEYVNFSTPPYPHFIVAGSALYRPGDTHGRRSNIGIFDLIFIEYGELYITDGDTSYHLKENELIILKPDSTHYGHKKVTEKTKFDWLHFRSAGEYHYSEEFHLVKEKRQSLNIYIWTGQARLHSLFIRKWHRRRAANLHPYSPN